MQYKKTENTRTLPQVGASRQSWILLAMATSGLSVLSGMAELLLGSADLSQIARNTWERNSSPGGRLSLIVGNSVLCMGFLESLGMASGCSVMRLTRDSKCLYVYSGALLPLASSGHFHEFVQAGNVWRTGVTGRAQILLHQSKIVDDC